MPTASSTVSHSHWLNCPAMMRLWWNSPGALPPGARSAAMVLVVGDVKGLPDGVGVPRGMGGGSEVDRANPDARGFLVP